MLWLFTAAVGRKWLAATRIYGWDWSHELDYLKPELSVCQIPITALTKQYICTGKHIPEYCRRYWGESQGNPDSSIHARMLQPSRIHSHNGAVHEYQHLLHQHQLTVLTDRPAREDGGKATDTQS